MSSWARRMELAILRKQGRVKPRHKATRNMKGTPYRHCKLTYDEKGEIISWVRYH